MTKRWADEVSYQTGGGADGGLAAFALTHADLTKQRIDHAFLVTWNGRDWDEQHTLTWSVAGVCRISRPRPAWIAVGVNGQALVVEGTLGREEPIGEGEEAAGRIGFLRAARSIEGRAYAVGMCRQVYCRTDEGVWQRIDRDCRRPSGDWSIVGFESIDGFAANDLYAVGLQGEIWHGDGVRWSRIDSPTNVILTQVCCAEDGIVYACGRKGMLLKGRADRWEVIEHSIHGDDFWGMAWFKGRLFIATLYYLCVFDGANVVLVTADGSPSSAYHLSATADRLWSIGPHEVSTFDGTDWERFD
jgi:hypothetical protein